MINNPKYNLAFTAASLRLNEMVKSASIVLENDIDSLNEFKNNGHIFSLGKERTINREFSEIRKRIEKLTPGQLEILAKGDLVSQKQIAFLAVCKLYEFIKDFTIEVVRDKSLMFDYKINESDYNSFINNRLQIHPELEHFSETTAKKAKQVLFLIMEQAGIINNIKDKMIQPQLLQNQVLRVITEDDPLWLRIFMVSDYDIKQFRF